MNIGVVSHTICVADTLLDKNWRYSDSKITLAAKSLKDKISEIDGEIKRWHENMVVSLQYACKKIERWHKAWNFNQIKKTKMAEF